MSCKLPHVTAEANAKAFLKAKKIIDSKLNIKDLVAFRKENTAMRKHGIKEYGVDTQWFYEEQGGKKAVPNTAAFKTVDSSKGIFYQKSNASSKEKEKVTEGVDEIFAGTPELASIGTKEQYSSYLKTLFPNSKTKDILTVATQIVVDTVEGVKKLLRQKKDYKGGYIRVYKDFEGFGQTGKSESKDKKVVINVSRKNVQKTDVAFDENVSKEVLTKYGIPLEALLDVGLINEARNELKKALKSPSKRVRESHSRFREVLNSHKTRVFRKHPSLNSTNINAILNDINAGMAEAGTDTKKQDYYKVREEKDIVFLGTEKDIEGFRNYTNVYKQKKPSNTKQEIDKKLEQKLKTFLSGYGISIEFVESLKDRGYDAIAIADISNKLILVSRNEADYSTLPEEVAHVAVELLGENNPMVKRLMDIIDQTDIYETTYNEYKSDVQYQKDGKPDITKIKKEAIGKAISKQLTNKESNKVISGTISKIWNKIKSMFKKIDRNAFNKEVDSISGFIASDIVANTLKGDEVNLIGKGIFKQKTNEKKSAAIKRAESSIQTLLIRLKNQERRTGKEEQARATRNTIGKIKAALIQKQAVAGVGYFIDHATLEAEKLMATIHAFSTNSENLALSSNILKDIHDFNTMYASTLNKELIPFFSFDPEFKNDEDAVAVMAAAKELQGAIEYIQNFYDHSKNQAVKSIIDVEAKGTKESREKLAEEVLSTTDTDTSYFRRHLLSLKHASDEILRVVYNMMEVAKNKADRATLNIGKQLTNLHVALEDTGFKDFNKFYEKYTTGKNKGKKTGNLISKYNIGEFNKKKNETRDAIANAVGVEEYSDVHYDSLSLANKQVFKKEWHSFNQKYINSKTQEPTSAFLNSDYVSMGTAEKAYYNKLVEVKEKAMGLLPVSHQKGKNLMPQMRKDVLDRLKSKEQSLFQNVKELVKESVVVLEDETDFGDKESFFNPITGKETQLVPVHYTRRLDNMDNLSDDITSMYVGFYSMAANFHEKTEIADDLMLLKEVVGERVFHKGKKTKEAGKTNTYDALKTFLDTHLYGEKSQREEPLKIFGKEMKNKKGEPVYLSKVLDSFNAYVRRNNLAFNPFTHGANALMGTAYNHIEAISGKYFTSKNKLWAEGEINKNLPAIVSQMGKRKKTNKIALLFEYNNITKSTANHFKDMNAKTAAGRVLFDSGVYGTYELVDYKIKGKVMLAMYDSYRFIDGEFITEKDLKHKIEDKAKAKQIWSEAKDKSLYNAYEVHDGVLRVKEDFKKHISINLENRIKNTTNQINNQIDGKLTDLDRSSLHRNAWGRLILTHRGWLLSGAEARWKTEGYNYSTEKLEEGYHRTFLNKTLKNIVRNKGNFKQAILDNKNMKPHERENMRKAWADIVFLAGTLIIASFLNGLADDDDKKDDWGWQFSAYMGTRMELEAFAFTNPFEVIDILESPAAGINQVESILEGIKMFLTWDEEGTLGAFQKIERGGYKDYTKLEKLLIKRSYAKNLFEFGDPRSKNIFLRQKVL